MPRQVEEGGGAGGAGGGEHDRQVEEEVEDDRIAYMKLLFAGAVDEKRIRELMAASPSPEKVIDSSSSSISSCSGSESSITATTTAIAAAPPPPTSTTSTTSLPYFYVEQATGCQRGPIQESVLSRLLEKGISGVSGDTLIWNGGMAAWTPMASVEPFKSIAIFNSANWHYVDIADGQQKGPISTRMILHKIKEGDVDGLTLVYSQGMSTWMKVSEVSSLKDAMHKIAQEEQNIEEMIQKQGSDASDSFQPHQQVFSMADVFGDDISARQRAFKEYENLKAAQMQQAKALREAQEGSGGGGGSNSTVSSFAKNEINIMRGDDGVLYKFENDSWIEASDGESDGNNDGYNNYNDDNESDSDNDNEVIVKGGSGAVGGGGNNKAGGANSDNEPKKRKRSKKKKRKKAPNTWIYIKGLPSDVTFDEVKSHFSNVGLIALNPTDALPRIKIYRDDQGTCKGDASICYHNEGSVALAVSILDGGYIRPSCQISVSVADFSAATWSSSDNNKSSNSSSNGSSNYNNNSAAQRKVAKLAMQQALSWNEDEDFATSKNALKIVVIEGMFTPDDFVSDPNFEEEIEGDISEECLKFGEIEKITLFSKNPKGIVLVRYKTSVAAEECRKAMEGRFFAKRRLRSYYWDGVTNYSLFTEVSSSASASSGQISHSSSSSSKSSGSSDDGNGNRAISVKANGKSMSDVDDRVESGSDDDEDDLDDDEREEKQRLEEFGTMLDNQDDLPAEFRLRTE